MQPQNGEALLVLKGRGCRDADHGLQNHWLVILEDGSITHSAFWHQEEAEPIPPVEKFVPSSKVQAELLEPPQTVRLYARL